MAKMTKMTKADRFTALRAYLEANPSMKFSTPKGDISAEDMTIFLEHELELLSKKNSAEKKPTAQQTANEGVKTAILEDLEIGELYTITDIIKAVPECADLTNQRVSALVRQMVEAGLMVRTEDKRKAYFSIAEVVEE